MDSLLQTNDKPQGGFQLFAQHHGARLRHSQEINFAWNALSPIDRCKWQERAEELAAAIEPAIPEKLKQPKKKRGRNFTAEQRRADFRPMAGNDSEEDDDMGIPVEILAKKELEIHLQEKYYHDRQMIEEAIMAQTGGCVEKIKRLRFLLASVQTFGNVDDVCMMAEFAMNEFNLHDGVVDRISTIVGPWTVENSIQRSRAVFHSNETHRIPLTVSNGHFNMRELIIEILGRTEPIIAAKQGIRVGLYKGDNEDDEERLNRLFFGEKNLYHIVDRNSRRFIICLRQEYEYMRASLSHLKKTIGLDYEGFPCSTDRFVLADAFVDAVSACLGGKAVADTSNWLSALGTHLPKTFSTPWERNGELFCGRHRNERNSCCATVTASRASFIILYSLEDLLKRL